MAIEDIFARTRARKGFAQDVIALQQFLQQQQLAGRTQLPAGQAGPVIAPQFPTAQSRAGAELFGDFLLNRQAIAGRATLAQTQPITPSQIQAGTIARIQTKPVGQRTKEESDILRVARGLPTTAAEELTISQISKNRTEAETKLRAGKGILTPEQKISQTNRSKTKDNILFLKPPCHHSAIL